ncbi:MAG: TAXI family TRAP transporter solute-binding subunit [Myxococcota bacterium]
MTEGTPTPLAEPPAPPLLESKGVKRAILAGVIVICGVATSVIDLTPDLSHLRVTVLSGSVDGHYHEIVGQLAAHAALREGRVTNASSAGSVENVRRLVAARESCTEQFALVQAGTGWPADAPLYLLGRLAKAESMFFLGRDADRIKDFTQLHGMRLGVGPEGSGTARLAGQILASRDFSSLQVKTSHHGFREQLDLLQAGELDLGVVVVDEDADLMDEAVRVRGLQIAGFGNLDVVARRLKFARTGRIGAGQYDPVRMLPHQDKRVLRLETLVVSNGCASHSQTVGMLTLLAETFPDFIRHNKETPNNTNLPWAPAAKSFMAHEGPELLDEHVPWLVDIMPTSNWVHLLMVVSILFNAMTFWNKFRLWRLDADRAKATQYLTTIFGHAVTVRELEALVPQDAHRTPEKRAMLDALIGLHERMRQRCADEATSMLVPMGEEMTYRFQQELIEATLSALKRFRQQLMAGSPGTGRPTGRHAEAHAVTAPTDG